MNHQLSVKHFLSPHGIYPIVLLLVVSFNHLQAQYSAGGGGATGPNSIAIGEGAWATGEYSMALGDTATASDFFSLSFANSSAGYWSMAALGGYAPWVGVAIGDTATALTSDTLAIGGFSLAAGPDSIAIGVSSAAMGAGSIAIGRGNTALNDYGIALGEQTIAYARNSFVIGLFNAPVANPTNDPAKDPLFVVGNGSATPPDENGNSTVTPSNAFIIKRNGDIWMKPQGDLSMGQFTH